MKKQEIINNSKQLLKQLEDRKKRKNFFIGIEELEDIIRNHIKDKYGIEAESLKIDYEYAMYEGEDTYFNGYNVSLK